MNDFDLDARLKAVALPERPEDYWEDFPSRVRRQLRRPALSPESTRDWLPKFVVKLSVGFACLVFSLVILNQPLQSVAGAIFKHELVLRQQMAQFPHQLRVFMADEHGLHYLIAEKE